MPRKATPAQAIRRLALAHGNVTEGIACAGTVMERSTIKVGTKAFVFVGAGDAMVKLEASLAEARQLAAKEPARYSVGKTAWVKLVFSVDEPPDLDVLARWIAESYALNCNAVKPKAKPKRAR